MDNVDEFYHLKEEKHDIKGSVMLLGRSYSHRCSYHMSERSHLSARRLKTWLKSKMGDERFRYLAVLNGHKDRTDSLYLTSYVAQCKCDANA